MECTHMLYLVYVLHWPDDGCFTAETCSPDVIDISSMHWYTYVVFSMVKYMYIVLCSFLMTIFWNITVAWNETCLYVDDVVSFVGCYPRNVPVTYFLTKEASPKCHYRCVIFQSKSWDSSVREVTGCRLHGCLTFMAVTLELFSPSLYSEWLWIQLVYQQEPKTYCERYSSCLMVLITHLHTVWRPQNFKDFTALYSAFHCSRMWCCVSGW